MEVICAIALIWCGKTSKPQVGFRQTQAVLLVWVKWDRYIYIYVYIYVYIYMYIYIRISMYICSLMFQVKCIYRTLTCFHIWVSSSPTCLHDGNVALFRAKLMTNHDLWVISKISTKNLLRVLVRADTSVRNLRVGDQFRFHDLWIYGAIHHIVNDHWWLIHALLPKQPKQIVEPSNSLLSIFLNKYVICVYLCQALMLNTSSCSKQIQSNDKMHTRVKVGDISRKRIQHVV